MPVDLLGFVVVKMPDGVEFSAPQPSHACYGFPLTQPRTKRRRLRNLNFCSRACWRQLSFFSARRLLAAAISPGDFGRGVGDCASTENIPVEIRTAKAAEQIRTRRISKNSR